MKPLVSILIPAYNAERWIADTINSALAQTWPSKEIIIVDDGSRDRTLRVARQFASKDVCVVTQENQGASAARNKALRALPGRLHPVAGRGRSVCRQTKSPNRWRQRRSVKTNAYALFFSAGGTFMYRPSRAQFSANVALVRSVASRMVVAEDGTESSYANRHLARQPGADAGRWPLGHPTLFG